MRHVPRDGLALRDRKSTRLNSSHPSISYAVFCLKKKKIASLPYPDEKQKKSLFVVAVDGEKQRRNRVDSRLGYPGCSCFCFFFLMRRRPPRSTLFPTRRSSDQRHTVAHSPFVPSILHLLQVSIH